MESLIRESALVLELCASKCQECYKLSINAREKVEGLFSLKHNASSRWKSGITHTILSLAKFTFVVTTVSHTGKCSKCGMYEACITSLFLWLRHSFKSCHLKSNNVPIKLATSFLLTINKRLSFLLCKHNSTGEEAQSPQVLDSFTAILRFFRQSR